MNQGSRVLGQSGRGQCPQRARVPAAHPNDLDQRLWPVQLEGTRWLLSVELVELSLAGEQGVGCQGGL